RPAVSRNTASSVNHQSQLRVPPTPRIASLPNLFDNGKLRPEFCSKVLLPDPGGPITTYHGKAYRLVPPLRFLRKVSTASWKRPCNCARSLAERSLRSPSAAGAPCSLRSLAICLALPRTHLPDLQPDRPDHHDHEDHQQPHDRAGQRLRSAEAEVWAAKPDQQRQQQQADEGDEQAGFEQRKKLAHDVQSSGL